MTDHGQQHEQGDLLDVLPGCPEEVWDGPYQYRCAMGTKGVCHRHGPFTPARRCTAEPRCGRPANHGGKCVPIAAAQPAPREQGETLRAAQVKAARDILLQRVALLPGRGWTSEQLAAELVDAVMALAVPHPLLTIAVEPELTDEQAEDLKRRFLEAASQPQRMVGLPPNPVVTALDACPVCPTDPHDEPDRPHVHATAYGYAIYAPEPDRLPLVQQLTAAGYAAAVANLRNANAVVTWLGNLPFTDRERADVPGQRGRNQLADYLEAVGPGAGDETKTDVILPDGTHRYWSTMCRSGRHDECRQTCKCHSSPCICPDCDHAGPPAPCEEASGE